MFNAEFRTGAQACLVSQKNIKTRTSHLTSPGCNSAVIASATRAMNAAHESICIRRISSSKQVEEQAWDMEVGPSLPFHDPCLRSTASRTWPRILCAISVGALLLKLAYMVMPSDWAQNGHRLGAVAGAICFDIKPDQCRLWAKNGECSKNWHFMHTDCQLSCSRLPEYAGAFSCAPPPTSAEPTADALVETSAILVHDTESETRCTDQSALCAAWHRAGECETNPDFMHLTCRKICGRC